MTYTFDVFDTLITRTTATPQGIFALMQKELLESEEYQFMDTYVRSNFYELRIGAEQSAHHYFCNKECEDVTLEQIYAVMARNRCLNAEEVQMLLDLERRTELMHVIGIERNIELLLQYKQEGESIFLISDMYLDAATIVQMLGKVNRELTTLPLYVSSECKKCKATGSLYEYVLEKEKIKRSEWTHLGDHPTSDIAIPNKLGIHTIALPAKTLLPCEQAALEAREADVFLQLTIGAGVNARFLSELDTKPFQYGSALGGAIAYPYVWWLLHTSLKKGIRRLYFVARDGYLLKIMADYIIARERLDIQTEYIYGSRKAWRLVVLSEEQFDISLLLKWSHPDRLSNLEKLAKSFELTEEEFIPFLPERYTQKRVALTIRELQEIAGYLQKNEQFKGYMIEKQKAKRHVAMKYLKQSIDVSDEHFAFVELIGSGYTQLCLSYLMAQFTEYEVNTFFYQLDGWFETEQCHFYHYLPLRMSGSGNMELLFSAPHGHTVGYEETAENRIEPIMDAENKALLEYGLEDYVLGVKAFLEQYERGIPYIKERLDKVELSLFYRKYMAGKMDEELITYLGNMPYGASGRTGEVGLYAPRLTRQEIKEIFLIRRWEPLKDFYKGENLSMSINRCTSEERALIQEYQQLISSEQACQEREVYWKEHDISKRVMTAYDVPIDILKENIAIYAAGRFGQALYQTLNQDVGRQVVCWVDKDYLKYQEQGFPVKALSALKETNFDQLVIAVLDRNVARGIKRDLIEMGISEEKIVIYE
ncbi:MAG: hypothetical protein IJN64_03185 [Lachnospiraceae bacterium]|nr:hypothetical protein [Lachnospiraceae bacterium]